MNIFDIIAIIIFAVFVLICTVKGFMKILAKWGAFFAAMLLSKPIGSYLGEELLGETLKSFAPILGTVVMFILLYFVCRIIFGLLAKLITKALHSSTLDHILGAIVGVVGGVAAVFLFAFACDVTVAIVSFFNENAEIVSSLGSSEILKYFLS